MIRYSAYFDNDKQHRKQIADQQVLFDKMSVQMVELDKHVRDLKNTVLEKNFKISELKECVRNKNLEIGKCLERLNVCENKLHKMGQTNQTVHMIMPSKDNLYNGRKGIGFENPSYFEKAKDLRPTLYDEKIIGLGSLRTDLVSSIGTDLDSSLRTDLVSSIGIDLDSSLRTDLVSSIGTDLASSLRTDLDGSSGTDLVRFCRYIYKLDYMVCTNSLLNKTMTTTIEQQVALDEALVPSTKRLRIRRRNFRLLSDIQSKESTLQVVYDVLRRSPFFKAFLVTADVPEIYMQEFWATAYVHQHSIRFKMNTDIY
nr:hypothetical protein [Tanacetum cinerariifolium]